MLFSMVQYHLRRTGRKVTGGAYEKGRKKRLCERGSDATNTTIGANKILPLRTKGGGVKVKVLYSEFVSVYDAKQKKNVKIKIKNVVNNAANRNFARRNIITKGAVLDTERGKVKITSRPGQHGTINAVLVE